jgi:uncharacterized protein YjlB
MSLLALAEPDAGDHGDAADRTLEHEWLPHETDGGVHDKASILSEKMPAVVCGFLPSRNRNRFSFVGSPVSRGRMYNIESLKGALQHLTGIGRPAKSAARSLVRPRKPSVSRFADDGLVPNHPRFGFIHYRGAVAFRGASDPAAVLERLFEMNGWSGAWRNGIYDYIHYHPRTHEVLGVARGRARVRFGGAKGKAIPVKAGDVLILPAGTGHQALEASEDLLVVGAYPAAGKYDEFKASEKEHERAVRLVARVPVPRKDPVYGPDGPLRKLWRKRKP